MYQGVNGKGKAVTGPLTEDQVAEMRENAAYNFLRFVPIQSVEKVEAPSEVEDAKPITDDEANNLGGRSRRKTGRKKPE